MDNIAYLMVFFIALTILLRGGNLIVTVMKYLKRQKILDDPIEVKYFNRYMVAHSGGIFRVKLLSTGEYIIEENKDSNDVFDSTKKNFYIKDGKIHLESYNDGELHNDEGPAKIVMDPDGNTISEEYFKNGKKV